MAWFRKIILASLLVAIGAGIGYWLVPVKIKEVEKIVVREKRDVVVKEKIISRPDGTTVTERETTDKTDTKSESDKIKITERDQKEWLVTGGVKNDFTALSEGPSPFIFVQRRVIGEFYAGVLVSESEIGLGVTLRF